MEFVIVLLILFVLEVVYFRIADRYNIVDKPNERSSHSSITLRGGGIIFWFASLLYFAVNSCDIYMFFIGITLVSLVSFVDDIHSLSNKIRLIVQFIALSLTFYYLGLFQINLVLIILFYIFALGIINAYNFMDGINGITGLYTLVFFGLTLYIDKNIISFVSENFLIYPMLACAVFLFFNYRKKAKCFAGDVGSIGIAFWVIYIITSLILATNSYIWLMLLAVYGVDTVCTIAHRVCLKQNIFKAHRLHFYQILSNESKIDQRLVSLIYSAVQIIVSVIVIYAYQTPYEYLVVAITIVVLVTLYSIKFRLMKNEAVHN